MKQAPFTLRRWRRVEYDRLVSLGAFDNDAIELIGGQLIVAEPKGSEHATAVGMAEDALRAALQRASSCAARTRSLWTRSRRPSRISPSSAARGPTIATLILPVRC